MNADVQEWSIFSSILSSTSVEHAAPRRLKMAVLRICERVLLPTFSSEVPLKREKIRRHFRIIISNKCETWNIKSYLTRISQGKPRIFCGTAQNLLSILRLLTVADQQSLQRLEPPTFLDSFSAVVGQLDAMFQVENESPWNCQSVDVTSNVYPLWKE